MPRGGSKRAVVTPAGHPPVHQARVALKTGLRADAQPLGHPWPEPFDQDIGPLDQPQNDVRSGRVLQVDDGGPTASTQ